MALLCLCANAQILPIDTVSNKVSYQGVVIANGAKSDLYLKAKQWFVTAFNNSNYVLQMDDKESGKLIGKGVAIGDIKDSWGIATVGSFTLNYTVYITVKAGKYRYEVTDFTEEDNHGGNLWKYNNYDISELAADPKHKKKDGSYKKDVSCYIKLTDETGNSIANSIRKSMNDNIVNKDNF